MQKTIKWGSILIGALVIAMPFVAVGLNDDAEKNADSIENIAAQLKVLDEKIEAGISVDIITEEGTLTQDIYDKLFEDDAWEAEAEVLALEELEDNDYKKLYRYIKDVSTDGIDDEDDIEEVVIKDVTITNIDAEDKDADVELELKVYYEDADGDRKKIYTDVTIEIRDGEAKNLRVNDFK